MCTAVPQLNELYQSHLSQSVLVASNVITVKHSLLQKVTDSQFKANLQYIGYTEI